MVPQFVKLLRCIVCPNKHMHAQLSLLQVFHGVVHLCHTPKHHTASSGGTCPENSYPQPPSAVFLRMIRRECRFPHTPAVPRLLSEPLSCQMQSRIQCEWILNNTLHSIIEYNRVISAPTLPAFIARFSTPETATPILGFVKTKKNVHKRNMKCLCTTST
jgi:hypothetical protein